MMYDLVFSPKAQKGLTFLKKHEPQSYKKAVALLDELQEHPTTGTGRPKPLGQDRVGQWSRRITQKHRLVYKIEEKEVIVLVLSAWGHYDDK
ncbi:toxin-antitoxin system [Proteiniphilum saccharofermentans]|uniref:Putative mRNA interferase YoeB n=1 Tax=Proteiniphilum saccharofermentans TaxID=1642647 RepID=A0A1R3TE07_9BACT|nr:Txe/YoeB family addiction module toxin [Proteiniphilum saccharofermentans]SCD22235.1 toxin-antitoxin system [Proteiniphilum saccharofermentans]